MKEPDGLYRVASVISGYRASKEPIFSGESKTSLEYEHNTGIIISYSIGNVLEIIKENPIGYKISS